ncbi:uncharacterized protein BDZ99DRAFT_577472 [Mytilinidion resinicola]|uniref:Rhodopsin domain-containing protein n=1 Tax=Mytilinidion resinicola TaxID=574789 RepID=A0A6A6XYS5_9PEZI|nr:uncharacterized protein BDZ99DRAFT_577472 [Mytilinidion resinicola]KAF2801529.1 hypothetical protein BDZ99DRAFT_577472 [Mytilinidion resinicola]
MRPPGSVIFAASAPFSLKWQVIGPVIALTALATIFVALRWYSRVSLTRKVGWDDYLITFALALSMSMMALIVAALCFDYGDIDWHVDWHALEDITILFYTNNALYQTAINLVKSSIVVQFLRIFTGPVPTRICHGILLLLLIAACWGIFGGIFLCIPIRKHWHPDFKGHCINSRGYWYSAAGLNVMNDFIVWLFPMPFIKQLRLPTRQRIGLPVVFSLGGFVCIISVLRMLLVRIAVINGDHTKSGKEALLWSALEVNIAIICACMMALKPLLVHLFPRLMGPKKPALHNMRLPILDTSFWGTTVTTSARRSSTCVETPEGPWIKVDTETVVGEERVGLGAGDASRSYGSRSREGGSFKEVEGDGDERLYHPEDRH